MPHSRTRGGGGSEQERRQDASRARGGDRRPDGHTDHEEGPAGDHGSGDGEALGIAHSDLGARAEGGVLGVAVRRREESVGPGNHSKRLQTHTRRTPLRHGPAVQLWERATRPWP